MTNTMFQALRQTAKLSLHVAENAKRPRVSVMACIGSGPNCTQFIKNIAENARNLSGAVVGLALKASPTKFRTER